MVRGLDLLRERMKPHEGSIVLIGGAACDDWFSRQSLQFRATQDLDIVLIVELLGAEAVNTLRRFIRDGQYETRARSNGKPELYRFADPKTHVSPKNSNCSVVDRKTSTSLLGKPCRSSLMRIITACLPYFWMIDTMS